MWSKNMRRAFQLACSARSSAATLPIMCNSAPGPRRAKVRSIRRQTATARRAPSRAARGILGYFRELMAKRDAAPQDDLVSDLPRRTRRRRAHRRSRNPAQSICAAGRWAPHHVRFDRQRRVPVARSPRRARGFDEKSGSDRGRGGGNSPLRAADLLHGAFCQARRFDRRLSVSQERRAHGQSAGGQSRSEQVRRSAHIRHHPRAQPAHGVRRGRPHLHRGALARIEGQMAILKLFQRFPNLRRAEDNAPEWRATMGMRGLAKLEVLTT